MMVSTFSKVTLPSWLPFHTKRSKKPKQWLGVDIGQHSIKLAVVKRTENNSWVLEKAQRIVWPHDDEPFASPRQFGESVRRVLSDLQLTWDAPELSQVAFSLPTLAVNHETLSEAKDSESDLEALALAKMSQAYSDQPSNLAFDTWCETSLPNSAQNTDVQQLVWADTSVVKHALRAFRDCSLNAEVLDASTFITMRLREMPTGDESAASQLVVDWGPQNITFTFILDGLPQFSRTTHAGGVSRLMDAIKHSHSFTDSDMEYLFTRYGLSTEPHGNISSIIESSGRESLQLLLDEIDQTCRYLNSRFYKNPVEHCLLIGGGAAIKNLDSWLALQLGFSVSQWGIPVASSMQSQSNLATSIFAQAAALSALAYES